MGGLRTFIEVIQDFLYRGGNVIAVIAFVIWVMWTLILERILYITTEHRARVREGLAEIETRPDQDSWHTVAIREGIVSRIAQRLRTNIPMIKTLAAVCPLLGLLGTVTGMIVIFDVMAAFGSSSPRSVASGVAQATMTTMAGMVGALSGVFPAALLARRTNAAVANLEQDIVPAAAHPAPFIGTTTLPVRLLVSMALSWVITAVLVFGMQSLIATGKKALTEDYTVYMAEFVRIAREETLETKELKPERPETPDETPETTVTPELESADSMGVEPVVVSAGSAAPDMGLTVAGLSGFEMADADYMPLVKVLPIYPRRAQALGLEGWVLVRFTVTTTGAVKDVVVVESTDKIFEKAAVQAALKFKYKPRVIDGEPVEVTGVLHYIKFGIEED